jgi:hypothetical protein
VTLADATVGTVAASAGQSTPQSGQRRALDAVPATAARRFATAGTEVIHTTASHPWLSGDHGWVRAGTLHVGEPVRLLDGATATVVGLRVVPGAGPMWDLALDATHTFAVGKAQAVVHNCPIDSGGGTLSQDEMQQGLAHAKETFSTQYDTSDWKLGTVENNGSPNTNDDPELSNYPSRYYFRIHTPDGPAKISADFNPETRGWNTDLGQRFHLSGTQYNEYWQDQSDMYRGF